jgi:hypothetical protein
MDNYGLAWRHLQRTRGRIRHLQAQAALLWWSLLPPFLAWIFVLAEHLGSHEPAARMALRRGFLIVLAAWLAGLLLALAWRLVWKRGEPGNRSTALLLGAGDDEIRDRLLNGIQVIEAGRENRRAFDPGLIAASLDQVMPRLRELDPARVLPLAARRRALAWLGAGWGLALLFFVLGGADARLAARRLLEPERDFRGAPQFRLVVSVAWPDSSRAGQVLDGESLDLRIEALGEALPDEVELRAEAAEGGSASGQPAVWHLPLRLGRATLAGFTPRGSLRLSATALEEQLGQTRRLHSEPVAVTWLRLPRLDSLSLRITPPRYTGLPDQTLADGTADFSCPAGSRVEIRAYSRDSLRAAWVELAPRDSLSAARLELSTDDGGSAAGQLTATASRRWAVLIEDRHGLRNAQPLLQSMTVLPDLPPRLRVISPREQEGRLGRDLSLDIALLAEDDHGFGPCRLAWKVSSATMRRLAPPPDPGTLSAIPSDWKQLDLPLTPLLEGEGLAGHGPNVRRAVAEMAWDLATTDLLPDDELHFFFELWDNDGWRGPKAVRSALYRWKVPGLEELFAEVRREESELAEEAGELLEDARENRRRMEELRQELRRDPEMTWEREQKLKQVVREQEQIAERAGELSRQLEQTQQKMELNQLVSEELRRKLSQLKQLLDQVMSPELLEKMRRAAEEALRQPPPNQPPAPPRQDLEEVLRQMEEQLDRFLAVLEQMRLEQRLEELAKRAEDLLERQRQLQQDLRKGDDPRRRSSEEAAREREAESLRRDMEALQDEFGRQPSYPREQMDEARQQMEGKRIPPRLGEMREQMEQGSAPSPESQEEMDDDLNQLAEALEQALRQSRQQAMADLSREIERLCQELLVISLRQEEIGAALAGLGSRSARVPELAEETLENRLGVQATAQGVHELTRKSLHIPVSALGELGHADRTLGLMLEGFHERQLGRPATVSPEAMGHVNTTILLLKDAQNKLQQSSSSSGLQEMMEKMAEAASRQQCLNGQCNKLLGAKPGSSQKPMSISFGEAQGEQQAIRESLEALQEKLGEEGKPRLGDLGQTATDMREVERDLADQTYTERTQKLQERIHSRLLDAQRSVRRQDEEKKRESRSAEDLRAPLPAPVELQRERALERDLLRALEGGYRPEMQDLIRDYFRALDAANPAPTAKND